MFDGAVDGVADADTAAEGDAELGAAWLLLLSDDKQPVIDSEATITSSTITTNNFFIICSPLTEK